MTIATGAAAITIRESLRIGRTENRFGLMATRRQKANVRHPVGTQAAVASLEGLLPTADRQAVKIGQGLTARRRVRAVETSAPPQRPAPRVTGATTAANRATPAPTKFKPTLLPPAAGKVRPRRASGVVATTIEPPPPDRVEVQVRRSSRGTATAPALPGCGITAPARQQPPWLARTGMLPPSLAPAVSVPPRPSPETGRAVSQRAVMLRIQRRRISAAASAQALAIVRPEGPRVSVVRAWVQPVPACGGRVHSGARGVFPVVVHPGCLPGAAFVAAVAVVVAADGTVVCSQAARPFTGAAGIPRVFPARRNGGSPRCAVGRTSVCRNSRD